MKPLHLLPALLAAAPAALAQVIVPPGLEHSILASGAPLGGCNDLAVRADGQIFVSMVSALVQVDPATGAATQLASGPPLKGPGQIAFGDGSAQLGTDLLFADWNELLGVGCCSGSVIGMDPTGTLRLVAGPSASTPNWTDPFGIAVSSGGAFGAHLYIMDYAGFSFVPSLSRMDVNGNVAEFLTDPTQWTASQRPSALAFDTGGTFGGDLFVADTDESLATGTIWRVTPQGVLTPFYTAQPFSPRDLAFATGGNFGTDLYVLNDLWPAGSTSEVVRIDPSGVAQVVVSGLPFVAGSGNTGGLGFDPLSERLYVGISDEVHLVGPPDSDPTFYCTARTDSQGCTPVLAVNGTSASLTSQQPFDISATVCRNNKFGALIYGYAPAAIPFAGGLRCVAPPFRTVGAQWTAGSAAPAQDCSGAMTFAMHQWLASGRDPSLTVGTTVYAQYWYRDQWQTAELGLSEGLSFGVLP